MNRAFQIVQLLGRAELDLSTPMDVRPNRTTKSPWFSIMPHFAPQASMFRGGFFDIASTISLVHHRCQPSSTVTSYETFDPLLTASLIRRAAVCCKLCKFSPVANGGEASLFTPWGYSRTALQQICQPVKTNYSNLNYQSMISLGKTPKGRTHEGHYQYSRFDEPARSIPCHQI